MSTDFAVYDIRQLGAVGDGLTDNTAAIQAAADVCRDAEGGTILVPEGVFLTGIIRLYGNTTLKVERGGRLLGSPIYDAHRVGGAVGGLLYAFDAPNLVLTGNGILDGNAAIFFSNDEIVPQWPEFELAETRQGKAGLPYGSRDPSHGPMLPMRRPGNMLVFARCQDLLIEGVTLTGASYWTTHCADCDGVTVRNLTIENDQTHPNNDGIHFSTCRNVLVEDCRIVCGDDAIAITGFNHPAHEPEIELGFSGLAGAAEDIEVRRCYLSSRSSAVRIGYGKNPVRRVQLRNLEIADSNRGVGIYARQADVDHVTVEDCRVNTSLFHGNWWGRGEPIQISTVLFPGEDKVYCITDIVFRDIEARGENAFTLYAEEDGAIARVKLTRVACTLVKGRLFEEWGGNLDLRPAANKKIAVHAGGTAPFWSVGAADLELIDCQWLLDESGQGLFDSMPAVCRAGV